ncbi:MAG TPA: hypothetical protein VNA14_13025 [Mycobacteriales bacterium]|nr:hypothetical protein [Mycobacteriales bacterium]
MTTFTLERMRRLPARHAKSAILLAGCVSLVMALLVTAITAAVGLGGLGRLGGLFGGNQLDYARGPLGEYFPLTDAFVQDELGPSFGHPIPPAAALIPPRPASPAAALPAGRSEDTTESVPPRDEAGADLRNDDFSSAYAVRGLPYTSRSSQPSDRQPGEPTSCASSGGTMWFRFTPLSDVALTATTAGSDLSTAIGVFTGTTLTTLRQESCDADPAGNSATTFSARRGTTYWFQVTRTLGSGAVVFSLDLRGTTTLVREVDGNFYDQAAVSGNGRYVVYSAEGELPTTTGNPCVNLRSSSTSGCQQIYVRDLRTGSTELISSPDNGESDGDENSKSPAITPDGRYVAFYSLATELVPDDHNAMWDAFVRDRATGRTTRVSVTSEGEETRSEGIPETIAISADGRYVAFESSAPGLVVRPDDGRLSGNECCREVFVHDTATGQTRLVSTDEEGNPDPDSSVAGLSADGQRVAFVAQGQIYVSDWRQRRVESVSVSYTGFDVEGRCPSGQCLSADGRYAVFQSAEPAVVDDTNGEVDVFVRDLVSDRTTRVSVASTGAQSHPPAGANLTTAVETEPVAAAISPDGRHVAFSSEAPDLVAGDTNSMKDIFVHDLRRRTTSRVSVLDDGGQSESGTSYQPSVSNGARTVVFTSEAFTTQDGPTTYGHYARQRPEV